jgi:DNA-binding NarL/FixJ family response regulator
MVPMETAGMTAMRKRLEPIEIVSWRAEDDGPYDEPMTAAEYTRYVREQLAQRFPVGDLTGDLTRFLEAKFLGCNQWQAAEALAAHRHLCPTRLADPQAKGHLRRLIRERGRVEAERYLREVAYPKALLAALDERDEAQHIRLGRRHVKDARARRVKFMPEILRGHGLFYRWLRKHTIAHVGRLLAEEDTIVRPEHHAPAFYGRRIPAGQFFGRLSTEERTLLRLLGDGASHAEVAAALDVSRSVAKQRAYRLRRKLARR